ncbi:isochorismate synthase [Shewanella cyperi]|uniref:Isochorismate synthase MenF n=1 Tax=Shewanella cyperi TaxID=2814292 RepID=A0A975ALA5_9GAMM|nr:isochorismate synthase [Shewanella cyperi]QSX30212.1 isochorismate synthase [Shewanella cyperi]
MSAQPLAQALETLKQLLLELKRPDTHEPLLQLSLELTPEPLLPWLASQEQYPRIYWQGREKKEEAAAIGICAERFFDTQVSDHQLAESYQRQRALSSNPDLRYYGGLAFDRQVEPWPEFGRARFVLPRVELRRSGNSLRLLLNLDLSRLDSERQSAIATLTALRPTHPQAEPKINLLGRSDIPGYSRWQELVQQVTHPAFNQETPKVVLSRQTRLQLSENLNPWLLLARWQRSSPNSFQFGFQFSPERAFISCSPERLYRRHQSELFTEALAGTTLRGQDPEQDALLARQLLDDCKNSRENQLVRQHIVENLGPLCNYVGAEESPTIFKLPHIQHLHRAIRAELKAGINDFQLLQALHPTPAVGGLPRERALQFIRQQEGYNRGWYAGACGYFNKLESEFSVAIRSALVEPARITLFAGAGIVAGSDPAAEWQELENKLATIMSVLRPE